MRAALKHILLFIADGLAWGAIAGTVALLVILAGLKALP